MLGVTKNRIIKYKIIEESINSTNFLLFMTEMVNSMSQEERINSIFVMDNCSSHLTAKLFQFYYANKLKILFNMPYYSKNNMVENVFRYIKRFTYQKLYINDVQLKRDVKNILNANTIIKSLEKLYLETLYVYERYINLNKYQNLNNL